MDPIDPTRQITLTRVPTGFLLITTKYISEAEMRDTFKTDPVLSAMVKERVRAVRRANRRTAKRVAR